MMGVRMPSTIGHAIAGAAIAWVSDPYVAGQPQRSTSEVDPRGEPQRSASEVRFRGRLMAMTLACATIAGAPDADLAFGVHRTFTHSLTATALVAIIAAAVAARLRAPVLGVALTCAAAHASHLFLDWLAADNFPPYGIQLLWPFSDRWYISGLDLFLGTRHQRFFTVQAMLINARAVARELLILGPLAWIAWSIRVKAPARLPPQMARGDHAPQ